jgi:hypothetical protein
LNQDSTIKINKAFQKIIEGKGGNKAGIGKVLGKVSGQLIGQYIAGRQRGIGFKQQISLALFINVYLLTPCTYL